MTLGVKHDVPTNSYEPLQSTDRAPDDYTLPALGRSPTLTVVTDGHRAQLCLLTQLAFRHLVGSVRR